MTVSTNQGIRKFAAMLMAVLVLVIAIVGLSKYERQMKNKSNVVKNNVQKIHADKTQPNEANNGGLGGKVIANENVELDKSTDIFDPLVDDDTPDDNPEEIIEDPEME